MAIKKITATHRQAMLLYCQGMSIEEIATVINRSPGTVQNWFYRDQNFRAEFEKFKKEYIEEVTRTARDRMQSAADQAMQTLIELLYSQNERIRLDAARDLLDRTGFKPEDVLALKGSQNIEIHVTLTDGEGDES